ncbi:MAG: hypothetical protein ABIP17_03620 [Ilumatobacteraceae bacterium]
MSAWARPSATTSELEIFATGSSTLVAVDTEPSHAIATLRRGITMPDFHARPGHRPGTRVALTSARAGGDTDVVRPVLIDPWLAWELADSGALFHDPVDGLLVEERNDELRSSLTWCAMLTGDGIRPTATRLHLRASPSMVVTVLELIPQRRVRWNRTAFVRAAVASIETLAHRLELAADS